MQQVNMLATVPACPATDLTGWCLHDTITTEHIALNTLQTCSQAVVKHRDADWAMLADAITRHLPGIDIIKLAFRQPYDRKLLSGH